MNEIVTFSWDLCAFQLPNNLASNENICSDFFNFWQELKTRGVGTLSGMLGQTC